MLDFKMNLSAVGIDGLNQLGFGSDVRRQCIDGLEISRPAALSSICDPIGSHVPQLFEKKMGRVIHRLSTVNNYMCIFKHTN